MDTVCDVAIIGGGPAGTATALALARAGARVVMLERSDYDTDRNGEILSPRARLPLGRLGVWDAFLAQGHAPSPAVASVWGDPQLHEAHFIFNPYGHGWHIDRRCFDEGLASAAQQAGACVLRGARAVSWHSDESPTWRIEFISSGRRQRLQSDFLVDATGRTSATARAQPATRISYDRLVGIVGSFSDRCPGDHADYRTLVEAVESGWWYSARLPGSRLVVAYMTDADLRTRRRAQLLGDYLRLLDDAPHTRARVDGRTPDVDLQVLAANSSRLDRATGRHWLAVGDAAMAQDPLSAHGICRALESGIDAAEVIANDRIHKDHVAREYEQRLRQAFDAYLRKRAAYYGCETRWPHSTFWSRRASTPSSVDAISLR